MGSAAQVVINEIMYNPYEPFGTTNETEYVELYNTTVQAVDLASYRLDNGVTFTFPEGATLTGSGYVVVCENAAAFQDAYPSVTADIYGDFSGGLRNRGERLTLSRLGTNGWETADTIDFAEIGASDGDGPSIELVHPGFARLDDHCFGAWAVSTSSDGTPGAQNSVYDAAPPPVVCNPSHEPPLPPAGATVTFSCRAAAYDSDSLSQVQLQYRVSEIPEVAWETAEMEDGGLNGDVVARDGVYTVRLPPYGEPTYTEGQVLEFRMLVTDGHGRSLTAPGTNTVSNELGPVATPYSYLVKFGSDSAYDGEYDTYHILMTEVNRNTLETRSVQDDHLLDATLIMSDGEVFYNCGVRFRGGSSRGAKLGYRIELPASRRYESYSELNLNHFNALNQYMGHELANYMGFGVKGQDVEMCRVWLNGVNKTALTSQKIHCRIEGFDGHIIGRYFGNDDWGNRYKSDGDGFNGDLSYTADLNAYVTGSSGIYKYIPSLNNPPTAWADLQDLCRTVNLPTNQLVEAMPQRVDVRSWARLYALQVCMANNESGWFDPYSTRGDELRLYAHPLTGVFDIFPWDMDAMLERSNSGIWLWNHGPTRNLLFRPPMSPYYIGDIVDLLDTTVGNTEMGLFWDKMGTALSSQASVRTSWQNNLNALRTNIKAQISTNLTVSVSGTTASGPRATIVNTATVTLSGSFPQTYTATVDINGTAAGWQPWNMATMQTTYGKWSTAENATDLVLPANSATPVTVAALDSEGRTIVSQDLTLVRRSSATTKAAPIVSDETWSAGANGIVEVTGAVQILSGATVTVAADTVVLIASGGSISVLDGALVFDGTPAEPAWVLPADGSTAWTLTASGSSAVIAGTNAVFSGGTLTAQSSGRLELTDCEIRDSSNALGLIQSAASCTAQLVRCIVSDYAKTSFGGTTVIRDSLFRRMSTTGIEISGGIASIQSSTVDGTGATGSNGIRVSGTSAVTVTNGMVLAVAGNGISATGAGADTRVYDTLIHDCTTGLHRSNGLVTGQNNTISRCVTAFSGNQTVTSGIAWGNTNGITSGTLTATFSDIQQATTNIYAGTGNLNRNPWFRGADQLDFRLQPISPCLGAGASGTDMGCAYPCGANPSSPSNLLLASSSVAGTNGVALSWTDNSDDEAAFEIDRYDDVTELWMPIATSAANATNYTDTTVVASRPYSYRVRASHPRGTSLYTDVATITSSPESYTQGLIDNLRITEVMYNPTNNPPEISDLEEFIEFKNISITQTLNLASLYTDNDRYVFPAGSVLLAPQSFYVVARNASAFQSRYGFAADGEFTLDDKLSNSGEALWVRDALSNKVIEVEYDADWHPSTDNDGFSLVPVDANPGSPWPDSATDAAFWRASTAPGGSPGADDPDPAYGKIVISEVLFHTDEPLEDAVELYNSGTTSVDIAGWYLSDSGTNLTMYQIPGPSLTIPGGGYHVFYEGTSFNKNPGNSDQFELSSLGDTLYLSSGNGTNLTGFRASVTLGATDNGVSYGRYVKSDGEVDYAALTNTTFGVDSPGSLAQFRTGTGQTNAAPSISPVVINEIMYNPAGGGKEFVELFNRSGSPVDLFDPAYPTNTWRFNGAMEYSFPTGTTLAAGEIVLVTGVEPAVFRAATGLTNTAQRIFGPYSGDLNNGGESVKLYYADTPEQDGFVPYIRIDRVKYDDNAPWPAAADNGGPSLERIVAGAYGNDPTNWMAVSFGGTPLESNAVAVPTAGFTDLTTTARESDGMVSLGVRVSPTPTEAQGSVVVHYAVTGGTAQQPGDFSLASGLLRFWPNDGVQTIDVSLMADGVSLETNETVEVSLTAVSSNGRLGGNRVHTLTIRDTDIGSVTAPQINPGGTDFLRTIAVDLSTTVPGAAIYYTLDGADPRKPSDIVPGGVRPSGSAMLYTGTVTVAASARLKACAFVGQYNASDVTSALFVEKTPMYEYPEGTIVSQIGTGTDDAEEDNSYNVFSQRDGLTIGIDASRILRWGGLRFTNIALAQGAVVTNAYVQLTSSSAGSGDVSCTIYANDVDNAATFTTSTTFSGDISFRPQTTANVTWVIPEWTAAGQKGQNQRTVNIADVINEILARPGWTSGNAIALILKYTYVSGTPFRNRPAQSHELSPVEAPLMIMQYDADPLEPDADGDGMPDQWEIDNFGSADAVNGGPTDDWDDDGADNLSEYIADTDPKDPDSLFVTVDVTADGSGNTLRWPSVTTRLYSVFRVVDLAGGGMVPLQSNISGHASGTNSYTDAGNTNSPVYYRLKVAVPE